MLKITPTWILIDCHHSSFASRLWIGLAGTLWRRAGVKASKAVGLEGMMGPHWQRLPKPSGTSIDLLPYAWPIDVWWCKMLQLVFSILFAQLLFVLVWRALQPCHQKPVRYDYVNLQKGLVLSTVRNRKESKHCLSCFSVQYVAGWRQAKRSETRISWCGRWPASEFRKHQRDK